MKANSQANRLLEHFKSGHRITSLEAYNLLGITQLGARIHDLEQSGHIISRHKIAVTNRFGETCHVKEYWLVENQNELEYSHDTDQE